MADNGTAPRILIADDDDAIRRLVSTVCKRLGFCCDGAADGAEVLEKLKSESYDLLLLDLMMPRVTGYEVIDALRFIPDPPPVIVVTAAGPRRTLALQGNHAVDAVVTKPFELAALCTLIMKTAKRIPSVRSA